MHSGVQYSHENRLTTAASPHSPTVDSDRRNYLYLRGRRFVTCGGVLCDRKGKGKKGSLTQLSNTFRGLLTEGRLDTKIFENIW